jgi:uncharacterized membrane protein (DUF2068 family)
MKGNGRSARGVQLIGGFKFFKGAVLTITAIALLSTVHKDQIQLLTNIAAWLGVDPNAWHFQKFVQRFVEISPKLPLISIGMFVYAAVFTVEGVGLLMRKRWAEYLTVISIGGLLPFEIYEIAHRATVTRAAVMAVNVAIVVYLIWQLRRRDEGEEKAQARRRRKRHLVTAGA